MRKKVSAIVLLIICITILELPVSIKGKASVQGLHSYTAEQSAFSRILVYYQSTTTQREWQGKALGYGNCTSCNTYLSTTYMGYNNANGGNNKCFKCGASLGWGCGIYAMAHAIQWAGGFAKNSSNGGAFLDEFIAVKNRPWNGNLYENYSKIVANYGILPTSIPTSESALLDFFNKGGAIVTLNAQGGHYQCAVGIATGSDGETWVHMVDSTCYSTIWRLNNKGYSAYHFSSGAVQSSTANYGGGEYWISYSAFVNAFTKIKAFAGKGGGPVPQPDVVDSWTYRVVTTDGLNMRSSAGTNGGYVTTLWSPTEIKVTQKTSANGYTWGYGTSSTGYTGWIVVDNSWTTLVSSTVDSSAPSITNVRVYDVTSSGYTVSCSVSDNVGVTKVAFPTWTPNKGQDDLFSDWGNKALGTINNGIATYRVNTSEHNNETGCEYITHIYAYDAAGNTGHVNQSHYGDLQVNVPTPTISTTGIQLDRNTVNIDLGQSGDKSFTLKATIFPGNATNKTVHWWSDDQSIARVDETGLVTPVSKGTTVITAMAENGGYQATCTVNVSTWVNRIALNHTEVELDLTEQQTVELSASIIPNTATNKNVKWQSANPSVATVSNNGLVTPISEGATVVTCTAQDNSGVSADCKVTVKAYRFVNSVTLNYSVYEFSNSSEGGLELTTTLSPANASNMSVTWSSSNTGVATVSNGIVTPVAAGYARITCESVDGPKGVCDIVVHADKIKRLPKSLKTIEAETFYGTSLREVIVPEGITSIDSKAFGNCGKLVLINLPASVKIIASDAFSGSNVAFVCENTCYATEYADVKGIPYIIGSMPREVVISAEKTIMMPGQSVTFRGSVLPADAPKAIRWSIVEGSDIATISGNGNQCVLSANATGYVTVAATAINSVKGTIDISIIEHPTSFDIWFDGNGGSVGTDYKTAEFDVAIGSLPIATRDYYTFDGWYTQANGGTQVTKDDVFRDYFMGDITLYAHWTRKTCSITFNANGGSCETPSKTMDCGGSIGSLPTPNRTYYTSDGWYTAPSDGSKVANTTVFTEDTTLYAHWTLNGFGSWSAWSTISITGNENRQVETKTEQVQTGTNTKYNYKRYLYWNPTYSSYYSTYGDTWARNKGYSGSWQYMTSGSPLPVAGSTDGYTKYTGERRDGNAIWWYEEVVTEPVYSSVTYYRYRDRIK